MKNSNRSPRRHNKPSHQQRRPPQNKYGAQRPGSHVPRRQISAAEQAFLDGTPIDPQPRMRLEEGSNELTMRALDLICPIGKGQRGLIVAPPGSGKTTFLKHICQAVLKSQPETKLYCLLIDERPEEVTDFTRSVKAEVFSSSSDNTYEEHIATADKLMALAYAAAGEGKDVMVVIDSLTRLARVHNADRNTGKTMSGGVDARAMEIPRRIFGSARKIEHAGSLTIMATILVETGSRMDDVIFEEFKGTGNMEIVLSREVASHRIYPAIDISKSGTRKIEILVEDNELRQMDALRRVLLKGNPVEAANDLVERMRNSKTNEELLASFSSM